MKMVTCANNGQQAVPLHLCSLKNKLVEAMWPKVWSTVTSLLLSPMCVGLFIFLQVIWNRLRWGDTAVVLYQNEFLLLQFTWLWLWYSFTCGQCVRLVFIIECNHYGTRVDKILWPENLLIKYPLSPHGPILNSCNLYGKYRWYVLYSIHDQILLAKYILWHLNQLIQLKLSILHGEPGQI